MNSGQLFFRTSASCSKILNGKKYIFNAVNSGQTLFFGARASCSKTLNDKKYFNTVKDFRSTLFFRASAACSKILNDKKYIFNTVKSGHTLFFRASASCSKILNDKNILNTAKNFTANSVFQDKVKKFLIQYIQLVKTITVKFLVRENTTREELHRLELASKVTTDFAYNGTSRGLYKERYCRIEAISELKCM